MSWTGEMMDIHKARSLAKVRMTHPGCLCTGECQETKCLDNTEHAGVDICEDGCVWYNPNENYVNPPPFISPTENESI